MLWKALKLNGRASALIHALLDYRATLRVVNRGLIVNYLLYLVSFGLLTGSFSDALAGADCDLGVLTAAPTDITKTSIRKGNGQWDAPRAGGKKHQGVDLIVNASYPENAPYAVYSVAPGKVAYSRLNGTESSGYGNLVIIDHGKNCYSLYAHLAGQPFTPPKPWVARTGWRA